MTINVSDACGAKLRQYDSVSGGEMKERHHASQIEGPYSEGCFFNNQA